MAQVRVAAFVHRLLLVAAAALDPVATAALVATARAVLGKYPLAHQLLEGDEDRAAAKGAFKPLGQALPHLSSSGGGLGQPNGFSGGGIGGSGGGSGALVVADTPELTNPLAAAAWELHALAKHWHPAAAHQARHAAVLSLPGPHDNPVLLLKGLGTATLFHPPWKAPPPSPMHALVAKQTAQKHARQRRPVFLRVDLSSPLRHLGAHAADEGDDAPPLLGFGGSAEACGKALRALFRSGERQRLEEHLHRAASRARKVASLRGAWRAAKDAAAAAEARTEAAAAAGNIQKEKKREAEGAEAGRGAEKQKKKKTGKMAH